MAVEAQQGKSPLAIESIDGRYRRLPRGVVPPRTVWLTLTYEWQRGPSSTIRRHYENNTYRLLENFVARRDKWFGAQGGIKVLAA
jgi:hypothetical protein